MLTETGTIGLGGELAVVGIEACDIFNGKYRYPNNECRSVCQYGDLRLVIKTPSCLNHYLPY